MSTVSLGAVIIPMGFMFFLLGGKFRGCIEFRNRLNRGVLVGLFFCLVLDCCVSCSHMQQIIFFILPRKHLNCLVSRKSNEIETTTITNFHSAGIGGIFAAMLGSYKHGVFA